MNTIKRGLHLLRTEGLTTTFHHGIDYFRNRVEQSLYAPVRYLYRRYKYENAAPKRYDTITVDPQSITHLVTPHFNRDVSHYDTHIIGGDWDRKYPDRILRLGPSYESYEKRGVIALENFVFYRSAKQRFRNNVSWSETELYEFFEDIEGYDNYERYRTLEDVEQSLAAFDELFRSIRSEGYKSQAELPRRTPFDERLNRSDAVKPRTPPEHDEVRIDIGRNGELYFDDGRHRFTAARIAGVDNIPVRVLVRHTEWQRIRKEVAHADKVDELSPQTREHLDHPDLQSLRPDR